MPIKQAKDSPCQGCRGNNNAPLCDSFRGMAHISGYLSSSLGCYHPCQHKQTTKTPAGKTVCEECAQTLPC